MINIPKLVPLEEIKQGNFYFLEKRYENSIYGYIVKIIHIEKNKIVFYSSLFENFNMFSEITDFKVLHSQSFDDDEYNFFKVWYFYEFDDNWFLENKEEIIKNTLFASLKRPLPEIFQEIVTEE